MVIIMSLMVMGDIKFAVYLSVCNASHPKLRKGSGQNFAQGHCVSHLDGDRHRGSCRRRRA